MCCSKEISGVDANYSFMSAMTSSNESSSRDEAGPEVVVQLVLEVAAMLVGVVLNAMELFLISHIPALRSYRAICFVVSLSVSDLFAGLIMVLLIVIDIHVYIEEVFTCSDGICLVLLCIIIFVATASCYSSCLIAVDRHIVATNPLTYNSLLSRSRSLTLIGVIWSCSAFLAGIPLMASDGGPLVSQLTLGSCLQFHHTSSGPPVIISLIVYTLPTSITAYLYVVMLGTSLEAAKHRVNSNNSLAATNHSSSSKQRHRDHVNRVMSKVMSQGGFFPGVEKDEIQTKKKVKWKKEKEGAKHVVFAGEAGGLKSQSTYFDWAVSVLGRSVDTGASVTNMDDITRMYQVMDMNDVNSKDTDEARDSSGTTTDESLQETNLRKLSLQTLSGLSELVTSAQVQLTRKVSSAQEQLKVPSVIPWSTSSTPSTYCFSDASCQDSVIDKGSSHSTHRVISSHNLPKKSILKISSDPSTVASPAERIDRTSSENQMLLSTRRTILVLAMTLLAILLLRMPLWVVVVLYVVGVPGIEIPLEVGLWLACLNALVNPVLYFGANAAYRTAIIEFYWTLRREHPLLDKLCFFVKRPACKVEVDGESSSNESRIVHINGTVMYTPTKAKRESFQHQFPTLPACRLTGLELDLIREKQEVELKKKDSLMTQRRQQDKIDNADIQDSLTKRNTELNNQGGSSSQLKKKDSLTQLKGVIYHKI